MITIACKTCRRQSAFTMNTSSGRLPAQPASDNLRAGCLPHYKYTLRVLARWRPIGADFLGAGDRKGPASGINIGFALTHL